MTESRRRTGFEKDLREFLLKLVLGIVLGGVVKAWTGFDSWAAPVLLGVLVVFVLAHAIRGDSRNADQS